MARQQALVGGLRQFRIVIGFGNLGRQQQIGRGFRADLECRYQCIPGRRWIAGAVQLGQRPEGLSLGCGIGRLGSAASPAPIAPGPHPTWPGGPTAAPERAVTRIASGPRRWLCGSRRRRRLRGRRHPPHSQDRRGRGRRPDSGSDTSPAAAARRRNPAARSCFRPLRDPALAAAGARLPLPSAPLSGSLRPRRKLILRPACGCSRNEHRCAARRHRQLLFRWYRKSLFIAQPAPLAPPVHAPANIPYGSPGSAPPAPAFPPPPPGRRPPPPPDPDRSPNRPT